MAADQYQETIQTNHGIIPKPTIANLIERLEKTGSHDEFFKEVLSDLDKARRFLAWELRRCNASLPIDLARLQPEPEAMRNRELKKLFADALFKAPVQTTAPDGSAQEVPAYIFFLLEHKSYNDPMTALQVFRYQAEVWARIDEERKRNNQNRLPIPFILPIIVHHGAGAFTSPTNLRDMIAPMRGLETFLPSFPCELIDIEVMKKSEYPADWDLNVFFSALKMLSSREIFRDMDEIILKVKPYFGNRANERFIEILTLYLLKNNPLYQPKDCRAMTELISQVYSKETTGDLAPWWVKVRDEVKAEARAEGREEGREEGRAEGREEGRAEGREEGREEGILLSRRDALIVLLKARFGEVSPAVEDKLKQVKSVSRLDELIFQASCAANPEEFAARLP